MHWRHWGNPAEMSTCALRHMAGKQFCTRSGLTLHITLPRIWTALPCSFWQSLLSNTMVSLSSCGTGGTRMFPHLIHCFQEVSYISFIWMGGHAIKSLSSAVLPFLPGILLLLRRIHVSSTTILALTKITQSNWPWCLSISITRLECCLNVTASSPLSPHAFWKQGIFNCLLHSSGKNFCSYSSMISSGNLHGNVCKLKLLSWSINT